MTQQLLQVSTVFLMQQNELQEVKERLQKELQRVTQIQEALTEAAASHQEAVLTMIQNYENLTERRASPSREASPSARRSTASSIGELGPAEIPGLGAVSPMRSMSIPGSGGAPRDRRASVRTVHLPPVQREVQTFKQEPLPDEGEDEGIRYVDNLKVEGGLMGVPCKGSGDFVGTPACQWYRERTRGEVAKFVAIVGATGLEFAPTADHVGARGASAAPARTAAPRSRWTRHRSRWSRRRTRSCSGCCSEGKASSIARARSWSRASSS